MTRESCSHFFHHAQFGKHISSNDHLIAQGGAYLSHVGDVDVGKFC